MQSLPVCALLCPPPPSTTYQPQSEVTVLIVAPLCALHLHPLHISHSHKSPYLPLALLCTGLHPPPLSPMVHYMSTTVKSHHTNRSTTLCPPPPPTTYQPQSEVTVLIVAPVCSLHLHPLHINHSQKSPYFLLALICTLHLPLPWPTAHQHQWRQTGKGIREP